MTLHATYAAEREQMLGVADVAAQARAMGRFAEGKKPLSEAVARAGENARATCPQGEKP